MTPKPLELFEFGVLRDEGLRVTLLGGFKSGQLLSVEYDGVTWARRPVESAEQMEKRVIRDVREMLAAPKQTSIEKEQSAFVACESP